MESAEEPLTPPTPRESEDPFEYANRKRKNKKKGRHFYYRKNKQQDADDVNQQTSEDIETNCADYVVPQEDDADDNERQITQDSQMKTQPTETLESKECLTSKGNLIDDAMKTPVIENSFVYNIEALTQNSNTYELERFKKHVLYIFSHQHVNGHNPNLSVEKDEAELTKTFSKFGFEVLVERDLTKDELMDKLREFSQQDFTDYGCVAVAILTIGSKDCLIWAKDEQYSELELIKHFKVDKRPTLITKPKIFIVQASQGIEENMQSLINLSKVSYRMGHIQKDIDEEKQPYTLPVESDRLIIHSTYSGKPPNSTEVGSYFIQKLCGKIDELAATHDVESILTVVKREISIEKSEHSKETHKYWLKTPVITSTFIRKLYMRTFMEKTSSYADHSQMDYRQTTGDTYTDVGSPQMSPKVDADSCTNNCFLERFEYMKNCLICFIEDHPDDRIAQSYYDVAVTFGEDDGFNNPKKKMLEAISHHLSITESPHDLRYLHLYHMTN